MIPQISADAALTGIRKIADIWAAAKPDSLIDVTRQLRVEPITLVDQDCLLLDSLPEVMQSLLSIFAGYYLQAVAVTMQVGDVQVGRHLDRINPNRSASGHLIDIAHNASGNVLRMESYVDRLPVPEEYEEELALEAQGASFAKRGRDHLRAARARLNRERREQRREDSAHRKSVSLGDNAQRELKEAANLSVGKIFDVSLTGGAGGTGRGGPKDQQTVSVPVAIRLMANAITSASLVHILSHGTQDTSVKERYHAWRAGRLEFIKDLILCNDLIDARRRNLMKDKDGLYSAIANRQKNGFWSGILSGQPSIGMASNLVVMSSATADELEMRTNYQLKNFQQRQKIFQETALMIMVVIDKEWDRVTFYHRGIALPTQLGVRDLKAANKGTGPDVSDILRAYQLGNAPSL